MSPHRKSGDMGDWIYSTDNQNQVTVSESDLIALISTGQLSADALIWTQGESEWTRVEASRFSDHLVETAICAASGRTMAKSDMLQYGNYWLDPKEKDNFVTRLMSGEKPLKAVDIKGPYPYISPGKPGTYAKWLIVAVVAYGVAFNIFNAIITRQISTSEPGDILKFTMMINVASLVSAIISIPATVFYCIWINRCSKNSIALAGRSLRTSPGLTVGYYFIPFANLWMPLLDMKEIWSVTLDFRSESEPASHSLVHWWWGTWIGGGTVAGIAGAIIAGVSSGNLILLMIVAAFSSAIQIAAGILIFKIISRISERQMEIFE